jgi:hypothetical protein
MKNKRGAEEGGLGTIVTIILLLGVMLLVGWFVYTRFMTGTSSVTNLAASQIATAATGCQATAAGITGFCYQLKILPDNVYATCDAKQVRDKLEGAPSCDESTYKDDLAAACRATIKSFPATIFYGGKYAPITKADDCKDGVTLLALGKDISVPAAK